MVKKKLVAKGNPWSNLDNASFAKVLIISLLIALGLLFLALWIFAPIIIP